MNNIEAVSKVTNILKTNSKDDRISRRFILYVLKQITQQLLSQKLLDRTIFSEANLYSTINCFEFERIEVKSCPDIEFRTCNIIMKSKKPLPKLIFSRLGGSIKEVVSVDNIFTFTVVDVAQYRRNKKRQQSLKDEVYVYVGSDNHLYILDREIYTVDLTVLTQETEKLCDVSACDNSTCNNYWEADFIVPDKLIDSIFDKAISMLGVNKQIREDSNPNGIQGA